MESDERAIRELHATWIEAVNAGDLDRLLSVMSEDALFVSPGLEPAGRDEFPTGFRAGHQQSHIRCTSELDEVVVAGDIAHTLARDTLSVTPRGGGETVELAGRRLTIYRRQPDGRWLLARDIHTLAPVAR